MYPNPLIIQHAGIYTKEIPEDTAHLEIFELRPDLLIAWSIIESTNDGLNTLDMRGNWVVSEEKLSMFLINDDKEEMYQEHYLWDGNNWHAECDPDIMLNKRNGPEDIKDRMYFDFR
ncbi:hypothetical protein KXD93_05105 [Mucilaginibacter sp. BJC16-A38]|uniref:hypothetical protein n=1 Tax=Mucilaginibacter phenanthrenivorans TaxID=1234842 RepID=UPI002157BD0B|nr:hypothetical protein [Mucilaginibacter phenanthrenivorans]MCR8557006.1 hypothetical protein [Mucilaginibacter phenanthrenivorans]